MPNGDEKKESETAEEKKDEKVEAGTEKKEETPTEQPAQPPVEEKPKKKVWMFSLPQTFFAANLKLAAFAKPPFLKTHNQYSISVFLLQVRCE